MPRILVWDVPVRLLHWLLAAGFFGAFTVAQVVDDESPLFRLHMLIGLGMAFLVVLRLVWGLIGTRYARFASFLYGPGKVLADLRGSLTGQAQRYVGHNPGSSVAIAAMLALILGLAATGVAMGRGHEAAEDVHEVLAWLLAITVGVHVLGVAVYTWNHRENITLGMVDGRKSGTPEDAIPSARPVAGLAFLGLAALWTWGLVAGYDAKAQKVTLPLLGVQVQLGELEHGEGHGDHDHDDHDH